MLEEALAYASQGFHIFPILPGQKRPLTQNGFKDATTDPEQIRAWWLAHPTANIGWHLDASGLCAVDLDIGAPMGLDLPATMTVKTPSGGRHMIYDGRIPSSQSKLAPHVDTRGVGGYTLLPPSVVDGRAYEWVGDEWPQPVPAWVVGVFTEKPEPRRTEKGIDEIDTPERIAYLCEIMSDWPEATIGQGSNAATIELVNRGLDLCSHEHVLGAMMACWVPRCHGEWTEAWVTEKVMSVRVGSGRDSDIGCEVYPLLYTYQPSEKKARRARFEPILPRDFTVTGAEFLDPKTKLIPKGGISLIYGQPGSHKTNLALTLLFDIMENGARIIYAAGEGSRGVGGDRVPAHARARGIDVQDMEALAIVQAVPLLQAGSDVAEFVDAIRGFKPSVVVLDTLATATAGLDENSSQFSSLLTDNGPVGFIKNALGCTVIIVAHEGKVAGRGIRGHSGLLGNVDAAINVTCEGAMVEARVTKMRDGKDDFSVFAKVNAAGVPVPVWCDAPRSTGATSSNLWAAWAEALKLLGAVSLDTAATMTQVTEKMLQGHPHLAKTQDALRVQLGKNEDRLAGYQVGRGAKAAWLYAHLSEAENPAGAS